MTVVPGPQAEGALRVQLLPGVAAVVRADQAALLGLDDRPDAAGLRPDRHADAPLDTARQARVVGDVGPGIAAVGRAVEAAVRTAALQAPGGPLDVPQR